MNKKNSSKKAIKKKKSKINILTHELLVFTFYYLMLAPCDTPIF
jgi:hypothetical protein